MPSGSSEGLARPQQRFFLSGPRPCPYLYGRVERSIFTELPERGAGRHYEILLRSGFRRIQGRSSNSPTTTRTGTQAAQSGQAGRKATWWLRRKPERSRIS